MQKNKVMNLAIHNTLGVQVYPLNVNDLTPRIRFTSGGGKSCGISICITYTLMYCSNDSIVHAECVLTVYLYGCTCAHVQCAVYKCVVRSVH